MNIKDKILLIIGNKGSIGFFGLKRLTRLDDKRLENYLIDLEVDNMITGPPMYILIWDGLKKYRKLRNE